MSHRLFLLVKGSSPVLLPLQTQREAHGAPRPRCRPPLPWGAQSLPPASFPRSHFVLFTTTRAFFPPAPICPPSAQHSDVTPPPLRTTFPINPLQGPFLSQCPGQGPSQPDNQEMLLIEPPITRGREDGPYPSCPE